MRSITTLTLLLALGLTACPADDEDTATATATVTVTTPMTATEGVTTTGGGTTTGGTTADVSATMTPPTTTEGTTVEPGTETTVEPGTTTVPATTTEGTTIEPGTTTEMETGPGTTIEPDTTTGGDSEAPYGPCAADADCGEGAFCVSPMSVEGVKGNVCSPACSGPGKICPAAAAGVAAQQSQCAFETMPMMATHCALICIVGTDECGPSSDCEDVGIPPQNGVTPGICTHPA